MSLEDLFISENHDEMYIVMELLDCDLHYVINKSDQALGNAHHRYFMYQILKGVQVRHRFTSRSTVGLLNPTQCAMKDEGKLPGGEREKIRHLPETEALIENTAEGIDVSSTLSWEGYGSKTNGSTGALTRTRNTGPDFQ